MEKLTTGQKKKLAEQIKTLDPKSNIVALSPNPDFTGGGISYRTDSGLTLGERGNRLTDEEYVRAWLVVRLIRLFRYPAICLDIEHTYTIGRPSPTKAQIDIRAQLIAACAGSVAQKKKLCDLLSDLDKFIAANAFRFISDTQENESRAVSTRLLRDKLSPIIAKLPIGELIETAYDDLVEASELNYTEDPRGTNYCNAWWCFAEVTSKARSDYPIFFAEAHQVGYKRTTRHPEGIEQQNDLFRTDTEGNIVIDTKNPQTILDHLRTERLLI